MAISPRLINCSLFGSSLIAFLLLTLTLPSLRLLVFAPFCILMLRRNSRETALWLAALCGLLHDLLSSSTSFGLYSLCYALTTALLSPLKDRSLPLLATLFSALFASIHLLLFHPPLTAMSLVSNLLILPLVDGCFAFFWFSCPLMLYKRISP